MSNKLNVVVSESGKKYEVVPVRMKYIKNKFYSDYMLMKEIGLIKIYKFKDGADIVLRFLTAVFNDEKVAKELTADDGELTIVMVKEILEITMRVNELEDEDTKNEEPSQE